MPIYRLPERCAFPDPSLAEEGGLLAIGGDLSPRRLLTAYALGIFPWFSEGEPILWWSPDPRFVLRPCELHVPRSLRRTLRRELRSGDPRRVTADVAFRRVVASCSRAMRPGQRGTWITDGMAHAYRELHALGFAHSFECWRGDELVGGLYGVSLGSAFFGESMFAHETDASKIAFVRCVEALRDWGFTLVDCQVETGHLGRFGARFMPRRLFLGELERALDAPTRRGAWTDDFAAVRAARGRGVESIGSGGSSSDEPSRAESLGPTPERDPRDR